MARLLARPNTLVIPSSPDLRGPIWSSTWDEYDVPIATSRVLDRAELPIDTVLLARFLIGKTLARALPDGMVGGRIVETEAYVIGDPAGHGYSGMTQRNR